MFDVFWPIGWKPPSWRVWIRKIQKCRQGKTARPTCDMSPLHVSRQRQLEVSHIQPKRKSMKDVRHLLYRLLREMRITVSRYKNGQIISRSQIWFLCLCLTYSCYYTYSYSPIPSKSPLLTSVGSLQLLIPQMPSKFYIELHRHIQWIYKDTYIIVNERFTLTFPDSCLKPSKKESSS